MLFAKRTGRAFSTGNALSLVRSVCLELDKVVDTPSIISVLAKKMLFRLLKVVVAIVCRLNGGHPQHH